MRATISSYESSIKIRERHGQKIGSINKVNMDLTGKQAEHDEKVEWEGLEGVIKSDKNEEVEKDMAKKVHCIYQIDSNILLGSFQKKRTAKSF